MPSGVLGCAAASTPDDVENVRRHNPTVVRRRDIFANAAHFAKKIPIEIYEISGKKINSRTRWKAKFKYLKCDQN